MEVGRAVKVENGSEMGSRTILANRLPCVAPEGHLPRIGRCLPGLCVCVCVFVCRGGGVGGGERMKIGRCCAGYRSYTGRTPADCY